MEGPFGLPHSFFGRNNYVSLENYLWRQAFCSSVGNSNYAGAHSLLGTQQNDPSRFAAMFSGRLILASSSLDCPYFSIYAPKPFITTTMFSRKLRSNFGTVRP